LKGALGLEDVLVEGRTADSNLKLFTKFFVSEMRYALTKDGLFLFPKSDFLKLWQVTPVQIPVRKLICYRLPSDKRIELEFFT